MDTDDLIITSIVPQTRRAGRVSVFVNGEFVLGLPEMVLAEVGFTVGAHLTPEQLRYAQEEVEYRAARASAEIYLGYKPRTEHEVLSKLERKGFSPAAITKTLQHLRQQGYINDTDYASHYAESGLARGIGRKRIVVGLRQRGIDAEVAESTAETLNYETERDLALEFARRRARNMLQLDPVVKERRLSAMLQRRGFPYSTVRFVLEQILEEGKAEYSIDEGEAD